MNDIQNITEALLEKLRSILGPQVQLDGSTPLNQAGLDSVKMVELFIFIEKEYGLELLSMGLSSEDMRSAETLAGFVVAKLPEE